MATPIGYSAAVQLAHETGSTCEKVQQEDRRLKFAAPTLLPKQVAELGAKREALQVLQGEVTGAQQTLVDLVQEWESLLNMRDELKRTLESDRGRRARFAQSLINLEQAMTDFCSSQKKDEQKLVETEKQIAAFAKLHNIK